MKRLLFLLVLIISTVFVNTGCRYKEDILSKSGKPFLGKNKKFKIAFIYIGPPGDLGWTFEHDRGKQMIKKKFGKKVEVVHVEDVPEGEEALETIRGFAEDGYNMIFTTSFGYMDPVFKVATEFPEVYFEHCSGNITRKNLSTYFGKMYQSRYLSGLVAGGMTKTNIIGYVAATPIPEVTRGINAFTIGVREVNPDAIVRVKWTNTWSNPSLERETTIELLNGGADIIAQHQDSIEPQKAAKERGKYSIGYNSDMSLYIGDSVLTSSVWNWGVYYTRTVDEALKGIWEPEEYWGGLGEGVVSLAQLSPLVPEELGILVEEKKMMIISGKWDVFTGPIKDQNGNVLVAAGVQVDKETLLSKSFFVEGVDGHLK
ncbi:MAG: BMP family ABC transporter substrate-binding protein [bacterium]|nr:BMP family ABC transporter substrate-binding protein [bacterium]